MTDICDELWRQLPYNVYPPDDVHYEVGNIARRDRSSEEQFFLQPARFVEQEIRDHIEVKDSSSARLWSRC